MHSASPPARLDSFLSLDAVYLVASLAGTRTLIAGFTLQRPPPFSTAVEVYCVYPACFTARIYSCSSTLLPSHDPFALFLNHSPQRFVTRPLGCLFLFAETRNAHIYRSTEPRYLPLSSAALPVHPRFTTKILPRAPRLLLNSYAGPSAAFVRHKRLAICIPCSATAFGRLWDLWDFIINGPMRFRGVCLGGPFRLSS